MKTHPYHYSEDKNIIQYFLDWGVPVSLSLLYFYFYNFGKFSPSEMVKTSGLVAISLLALTLAVGPIARFFPALDILKAHRKFWGISSFLFLILHLSLVVIFYYKFNFLAIIDPGNPKFGGLLSGLLAGGVLLLVTLTSNKKAMQGLSPRVWKIIQTTSYAALILAVLHFYLMEQINGVLVIKRLLGKITFYFAAAVILIRLIVLILPREKK